MIIIFGKYTTICDVQGSFATGRLLSIPLATWFTPNFMLLCNIVSTRSRKLSHSHYQFVIITAVQLNSSTPTVAIWVQL